GVDEGRRLLAMEPRHEPLQNFAVLAPVAVPEGGVRSALARGVPGPTSREASERSGADDDRTPRRATFHGAGGKSSTSPGHVPARARSSGLGRTATATVASASIARSYALSPNAPSSGAPREPLRSASTFPAP